MEENQEHVTPIVEAENRQYDSNTLNVNANKTVNAVPEIEVEDETHLLHKNTVNTPVTPERSPARIPDPLEEFTPEELEVTVRVMKAMSRKRKEAEAAANRGQVDTPAILVIVNLASQFNQADEQPPSQPQNRGIIVPSERQPTHGTQI